MILDLWRRLGIWRWILLAALILVAGGAAVARLQLAGGSDAAAASNAFPGVTPQLAAEMQLAGLPPANAPSFSLVDQHGHRVQLAALRGKIVVLTFMDPHCIDICPLISQEFVDAFRDLGALANRVVFVAVNVNQYHGGVRDMATFTQAHGLATIPTWHFVTGQTRALMSVWADYNVQVQAPNPNADVVHTSVVYFIDAAGVERYIAVPMSDKAANGSTYLPAGQLAAWGHGIADVAAHMART